MAVNIVASMAEFNLGVDDWVEYSERFEMYLMANGVTDGDIRRAVFLSTIGGPAYKLLRSLVGEEVKTQSLDNLSKAMKEHLKPAPNEIAERFRFFKRDRASGESVNEYITELRRLSEHCGFKDALNTYLRDRFVCGLSSESVQQKLLATKELTLEKSLNIARSYEAASKDAKMIQSGSGSSGIHQAAEAEDSGDIHLVGQQRQASSGRGKATETRECFKCGNVGHLAFKCPYAAYTCHNCGQKGHLAKRCRQEKKEGGAKGDSRAKAVRTVCTCQASSGGCGGGEQSDGGDPLHLYVLRRTSADPVMVEVRLNGESVRMEVDTGAAVSVMSLSCFERVRCSDQKLRKSDLKLKTYTGEIVHPEGVGEVAVEYREQRMELPITVVNGDVPNLMGRDWLGSLKLKWDELFPHRAAVRKLEVAPSVANLVEKFPEVFTDKLGCLRDFKVCLPVAEDAKPAFFKARPVPYAMRTRVEEELDKLEEQGVWRQVQYSNWAAPIVAVLKNPRETQGPIRICGDYKMTVNKAAPLDTYPIPNTVDQLAMLAGGEKFSKLDLSQAYQQLELDESSREMLTINTHRGLYQPSRMQFGIHSATGIFQREMDNRLCRIPFTQVRVDDILVSGRNDAEHLANLRAVLTKLKEAGLTLCMSKCMFLQEEVSYCGYMVSKHGIKPMSSNVEAVKAAPAPTCVSELRGFLGMVNYYNMYLPKMSSLTEPLHDLLRKGVPWKWSQECGSVFRQVKKLLCEAPVLALFDMTRPIVVHCDASNYGVGAVLSHVMEDGTEKPVSYASRTLSSAERNYATVEKEGLALVYAVKKFHQFLFGNKFTMYTDHKPLLGLFAESSALPTRAASRVLRWALLLSAYNYELRYREGGRNGNADALSRLPLDARTGEFSEKLVSVAMMEMVRSPVTETEVRSCTQTDPVLAIVLQRILEGGLDREEAEQFKPYRRKVSELTTEGGCVLWGARVVIPTGLRSRVLEELHDVHPGIVRMKALARSYVWWPGVDQDIEDAVRHCQVCQVNQSKPVAATAHPWEFPSRPWERLHIDHAGPMNGNTFLVVVDSHSKWPEVERVQSTDAKTTCAVLRKLFATHGIPRTVVSDNGAGFASAELQQFLARNGVKHVFSAPYHPSSNGQAERYVRIFKEMLRTLKEGDVDTKLSRLLFRYRLTPQTTTGRSPAELLMNRQLRSPLSLMRPDLEGRVRQKQQGRVGSRPDRVFEVGQEVLVINFGGNPKWLPGVVMVVLGAANFNIRLKDGRMVHRHVDQVVPYHGPTETSAESLLGDDLEGAVLPFTSPDPEPASGDLEPRPGDHPASVSQDSQAVPSAVSGVPRSPVADHPGMMVPDQPQTPRPLPERRQPSTRVRRRPGHLEDYV